MVFDSFILYSLSIYKNQFLANKQINSFCIISNGENWFKLWAIQSLKSLLKWMRFEYWCSTVSKSHLPRCCCQYMLPSSRHSCHWDHSGTAESRSACPSPCTGWTHQTDACLSETEKEVTCLTTVYSIYFSYWLVSPETAEWGCTRKSNNLVYWYN